MFNFNLRNMLISLPGILMAISFHEFAHALVAHLNGDNTAKNQGRMSINPLSHIDPVGMITLLIAGFGWARPVPIDSRNFKNYRTGIITVALAGVAMNILLAILFSFIIAFISLSFYDSPLVEIFSAIVWINIVFAAFNLIPIPPLDGSRIVSTILPFKLRVKYDSIEPYGFWILILLIASGAANYILMPAINFVYTIVSGFVGIFF